MSSIYALFDPREPQTVRYVGKTVKLLAARLVNHLSDARRERDPSHKRHWISSLLADGVTPGIRLLETVCDANWENRERFWIRQFAGALTNGNDGGRGGHKPTDAAREKLRQSQLGKKASPETRMKMRLAHLGKHLTLEIRAKLSAIRKGRKLSADHARNIGLAHRGKTISEHHRRQISAALTGVRWTEEQRARQREMIRAVWQRRKEASRELNIHG